LVASSLVGVDTLTLLGQAQASASDAASLASVIKLNGNRLSVSGYVNENLAAVDSTTTGSQLVVTTSASTTATLDEHKLADETSVVLGGSATALASAIDGIGTHANRVDLNGKTLTITGYLTENLSGLIGEGVVNLSAATNAVLAAPNLTTVDLITIGDAVGSTVLARTAAADAVLLKTRLAGHGNLRITDYTTQDLLVTGAYGDLSVTVEATATSDISGIEGNVLNDVDFIEIGNGDVLTITGAQAEQLKDNLKAATGASTGQVVVKDYFGGDLSQINNDAAAAMTVKLVIDRSFEAATNFVNFVADADEIEVKPTATLTLSAAQADALQTKLSGGGTLAVTGYVSEPLAQLAESLNVNVTTGANSVLVYTKLARVDKIRVADTASLDVATGNVEPIANITTVESTGSLTINNYVSSDLSGLTNVGGVIVVNTTTGAVLDEAKLIDATSVVLGENASAAAAALDGLGTNGGKVNVNGKVLSVSGYSNQDLSGLITTDSNSTVNITTVTGAVLDAAKLSKASSITVVGVNTVTSTDADTFGAKLKGSGTLNISGYGQQDLADLPTSLTLNVTTATGAVLNSSRLAPVDTITVAGSTSVDAATQDEVSLVGRTTVVNGSEFSINNYVNTDLSALKSGVAQQDQITLSGTYEEGDQVAVTIGAVTVTVVAEATDTPSTIATKLAAAINADPVVSETVTATTAAGQVTVTADVAGTGYSISAIATGQTTSTTPDTTQAVSLSNVRANVAAGTVVVTTAANAVLDEGKLIDATRVVLGGAASAMAGALDGLGSNGSKVDVNGQVLTVTDYSNQNLSGLVLGGTPTIAETSRVNITTLTNSVLEASNLTKASSITVVGTNTVSAAEAVLLKDRLAGDGQSLRITGYTDQNLMVGANSPFLGLYVTVEAQAGSNITAKDVNILNDVDVIEVGGNDLLTMTAAQADRIADNIRGVEKLTMEASGRVVVENYSGSDLSAIADDALTQALSITLKIAGTVNAHTNFETYVSDADVIELATDAVLNLTAQQAASLQAKITGSGTVNISGYLQDDLRNLPTTLARVNVTTAAGAVLDAPKLVKASSIRVAEGTTTLNIAATEQNAASLLSRTTVAAAAQLKLDSYTNTNLSSLTVETGATVQVNTISGATISPTALATATEVVLGATTTAAASDLAAAALGTNGSKLTLKGQILDVTGYTNQDISGLNKTTAGSTVNITTNAASLQAAKLTTADSITLEGVNTITAADAAGFGSKLRGTGTLQVSGYTNQNLSTIAEPTVVEVTTTTNAALVAANLVGVNSITLGAAASIADAADAATLASRLILDGQQLTVSGYTNQNLADINSTAAGSTLVVNTSTTAAASLVATALADATAINIAAGGATALASDVATLLAKATIASTAGQSHAITVNDYAGENIAALHDGLSITVNLKTGTTQAPVVLADLDLTRLGVVAALVIGTGAQVTATAAEVVTLLTTNATTISGSGALIVSDYTTQNLSALNPTLDVTVQIENNTTVDLDLTKLRADATATRSFDRVVLNGANAILDADATELVALQNAGIPITGSGSVRLSGYNGENVSALTNAGLNLTLEVDGTGLTLDRSKLGDLSKIASIQVNTGEALTLDATLARDLAAKFARNDGEVAGAGTLKITNYAGEDLSAIADALNFNVEVISTASGALALDPTKLADVDRLTISAGTSATLADSADAAGFTALKAGTNNLILNGSLTLNQANGLLLNTQITGTGAGSTGVLNLTGVDGNQNLAFDRNLEIRASLGTNALDPAVAQVSTITLTGTYGVGDLVKATIGGVDISYTVVSNDIVSSNGASAASRSRIAAKLVAAINGEALTASQVTAATTASTSTSTTDAITVSLTAVRPGDAFTLATVVTDKQVIANALPAVAAATTTANVAGEVLTIDDTNLDRVDQITINAGDTVLVKGIDYANGFVTLAELDDLKRVDLAGTNSRLIVEADALGHLKGLSQAVGTSATGQQVVIEAQQAGNLLNLSQFSNISGVDSFEIDAERLASDYNPGLFLRLGTVLSSSAATQVSFDSSTAGQTGANTAAGSLGTSNQDLVLFDTDMTRAVAGINATLPTATQNTWGAYGVGFAQVTSFAVGDNADSFGVLNSNGSPVFSGIEYSLASTVDPGIVYANTTRVLAAGEVDNVTTVRNTIASAVTKATSGSDFGVILFEKSGSQFNAALFQVKWSGTSTTNLPDDVMNNANLAVLPIAKLINVDVTKLGAFTSPQFLNTGSAEDNGLNL
jgi:hypothetical protein